ncbi:MAG: DUF58 domain-containing protein [Gammaproteobacteria bacterium]|nr:DUF58 domain-containing protein [Gammaproteobacteria bacterium]
MKNIFKLLLNKLSSDNHPSHVVLRAEKLQDFFCFILTAQAKRDIYSASKEYLSGDKATEFNGSGTDYSESKLYSSGDDIRSINWKQTAKKGELISNQYYRESENFDYILFDERQSMFYGTKVQTKLAVAIKAALLSSVISINNNRKVKIINISDKLSFSDPIDSHKKALLYFSAIAKKDFSESSCGQINISALLKTLLSVKPRFSSISIISDFHDFNESGLAALKALALYNTLHITKIQDRIEKKTPLLYPVNYQSLSTERSVTLMTSVQLKAFNNAIQIANQHIDSLLSQTGVEIYHFDNQSPDKDLLDIRAA